MKNYSNEDKQRFLVELYQKEDFESMKRYRTIFESLFTEEERDNKGR